jgi:hypothetical protein
MNGGFRDSKNNCLAVEEAILHHESIRGCDSWITSPDAHEEVAPRPERFEDRNDVLLEKFMVLRSVTQKELSFIEGSAMLLDVGLVVRLAPRFSTYSCLIDSMSFSIESGLSTGHKLSTQFEK